MANFSNEKISPDNKSVHVSDYKTTHANKFLVKKPKIINKSILEIIFKIMQKIDLYINIPHHKVVFFGWLKLGFLIIKYKAKTNSAWYNI